MERYCCVCLDHQIYGYSCQGFLERVEKGEVPIEVVDLDGYMVEGPEA